MGLNYLQSQSLGHHAYVSTHEHHSLAAVIHNESPAEQASVDSSCSLIKVGIAHLFQKVKK